jgi:hypothetical protein
MKRVEEKKGREGKEEEKEEGATSDRTLRKKRWRLRWCEQFHNINSATIFCGTPRAGEEQIKNTKNRKTKIAQIIIFKKGK